ncbi:hypothetical protein [Thermophilibacter sp.]
MASFLGVGTGLAVWARDLVARGSVLRKARRENDAARGIVAYGEVPSESLLVGSSRSLVLGAPDEVRAPALCGLIKESVARGSSVVVVAEGARALADDLVSAGCPGVTLADAARPLYEPLARRTADDATELLEESLRLAPNAPQEAGAYAGALVRVLGRRGLPASVRLLAECPHNRLHEVIGRLELTGAIDAAEAADLRACLDVPTACRSFVEGFFREAVSEGALLADPLSTSLTTSVVDAALSPAPGTVVLDVGSGQARALLALVFAEARLCARHRAPLTLVVCAGSVADWDALAQPLRSAVGISWAIVTSEALEFFSSEDELRRWVASSSRVLCFAQGHASADLASSVFGEYDKVDVSFTRSGGGGFGTFGVNYTDGRSTTRSVKRERVVRPEELRALGEGEFFVLEAGRPGAGRGIAVR